MIGERKGREGEREDFAFFLSFIIKEERVFMIGENHEYSYFLFKTKNFRGGKENERKTKSRSY